MDFLSFYFFRSDKDGKKELDGDFEALSIDVMLDK